MIVRRIAAALAVPCACLGVGQAVAQDRGAYGPVEPAGVRTTPSQEQSPRLPVLAEPARTPPVTMLESWSLGNGAQLGLGRFRVAEPPRRRTNLERERSPLDFDQKTRAIAGAGLSIRFR